MDLRRRVIAEFIGTALLLAAVVGSGIMGERLASGNVALALLANSLATGAALTALILTFGPQSGAHFNPIVAAYWFTASTSFANPAVTLARAFTNTFAGIRLQDVPMFWAAQAAGAVPATLLFRWLVPSLPESAPRVVVPYAKD